MRRKWVFSGLVAFLVLFGTLIGVGSAATSVEHSSAVALVDVQHGIAFTKGCSSPTQIGQPYACTYSIRNLTDEARDTLTINGLSDVVHAASGNVASGNVFGSLRLEIGTFGPGFSTPPTCPGATGTGTTLDPFRAPGLTSCTLPFGSRLNVQSFSFYTVQPLDFNLPGHQMTDSAELTWHDLCDDPAGTGNSNCVANPPNVGAGSASTISQLTSTTATTIHNAAHAPVTAVAVGTTVHDFVAVTGQPGNPPPTGNVTVDWFLNGDCSGAPAVNSGPVGPLAPSGPSSSTFDATAFSFTVNTASQRAFRAHYLGDPANPLYAPSDGPCEPLNVVDANIQITPDGVNRVGAQHTFTAHVNVNPGTGFVPALDGTVISFSFNGGPSSTTCTTAGGTGSCTVSYSSAIPTVDTVNASTTVSVGGVSLTRTTNGTAGNSGPATKRWVNARIQITPNATNVVGQPHTFTVLLQQDTGNGAGFVAFPGQHVDFTLTPGGGATPVLDTVASTCDDAGANTNASGQCTIVFSSNTAGTVTGNASATVSVAGSAPFSVSTNGVAPNSGPAVKTYVNANIQITPANATNVVGSNHVLTITVNAIGGTIGAGPHTATASIVGGPGSFVGSPSCTYTGGGATATCTVTITSAVTGTTIVAATSDIPVAGLTITRATNTAVNTAAGGSGNANKLWVNANIQITPATATNPVGTNHVLTITVNSFGGNIDAGPHTATASIVSGPGSFVGSPSCTYTGGGATASCTVTITSAVVGTTVVAATSDIPVGGLTITRATNTAVNTAAGGSGNASKVWVNANIQITPATATNPIGTNHVLTITVNALGGTLGAGTATASIVSGPGSFVGSPTCSYAGGAANTCTVTITSAVAGTTVVAATSNINVGGLTITRTTNTAVNTAAGGSGNASKSWATARITITPNAVNEVGQPHTFTVAVEQDSGSGFVGVAGQHVDFTLTSASGASAVLNAAASTCDNAGPNTDASGKCTIVFTSATPGTVTGTATVTLTVAGSSVTLSTNGVAPNSGPAVKTFVDANIQITPATDTNPVGTPHVLTVHVNVNPGSGFVNAPAGTSVSVSVTSGPGTITGSPCLTVGATGSCTVTLNSATPGTSVISASVTTVVNTVTLTRTTNGTGANSAPAQKLWADSAVRTDVHNASHAVITTAAAGDVVHDKVFVTKAAGTPAAVPNPTGSVVFHRYTSLNCTGAAVDQTVALAADGTAESATFTVVDDMSYKADYSGDANYPAHSGACEPLSVQTTSICPQCPPPPCPAFPVFPGQGGGGGPCSLNVLDVSIKGNLLEITIQNTSTGPATLNQFGITWPTSNGALKSVSMNGYLYTGPAITGGSAMFTNAMLGANANLTRTIAVGQSQKLRIIFEKTASTDKSLYTSVAEFNTGCIINLFA